LKVYTYEIWTHNHGIIEGTVSAKTIEEATKKVKELYSRFERLKVKEEDNGERRI